MKIQTANALVTSANRGIGHALVGAIPARYCRTRDRVAMAMIALILVGVTISSNAYAADRAEDRAAIQEMVYCYAYSVDILGNSRPTESTDHTGLVNAANKFKECLTDDAKLRLFLQGKDGKAIPAGSGGPLEFAKFVRGYFTAYGYIATQHIVGNIVIVFKSEDEASLTSYIQANHWLKDGRMLIIPVRYEDTALRTQHGWKIAYRDIIANLFWISEGYFPNSSNPAMPRPNADKKE
jgi:hypothetical protein